VCGSYQDFSLKNSVTPFELLSKKRRLENLSN